MEKKMDSWKREYCIPGDRQLVEKAKKSLEKKSELRIER